jgi:hypothetical protein
MNRPFYVSVTGLKLKRIWYAPIFWWHAVASMTQVKASQGCLSAEARTIAGSHHTLSVWSSKSDMQAFIKTGAHLRAMKAFRSIATGKTYGFETEKIPNWNEVHNLWVDRGRTI